MSHLQEALQRMAENDPDIKKIQRVPVGLPVVYHGRPGWSRQGRTTYPAVVLKQHEDDGSLDLAVTFESEDQITEQRVLQWTEAKPDHSWSFVERVENEPVGVDTVHEKLQAFEATVYRLLEEIGDLRHQMYGEYEPPDKSMIEILAQFEKELRKRK